MFRYFTAGESHGKGLISIVEGIPANLSISDEDINVDLKRRQGGYGRGGRMKIESDKVQFISGVRHGKTIGSPVTMFIENKDWTNWQDIMSSMPIYKDLESLTAREKPVTRPRPGHADLSGALKYNQRDVRNILERSSARETAIRVAVGALAKKFLSEFNICVYSWVTQIGKISFDFSDKTDNNSIMKNSPYYSVASSGERSLQQCFNETELSEVRCPDKKASALMISNIDKAKENGDSLGGIFEVIATGLPVGIGSHVQYDRKLDAAIAGSMMSIQAIKGVEIGIGFEEGRKFGSEVHDEISYQSSKFLRKTNFAGGIEGGMSNGEDIVIRAAMKPIPTLYKPLMSVDIESKMPFEASVERSDTCAVPAASVIGEAVVSIEIAKALIDKFGGDSMEEIIQNFNLYKEQIRSF